MCNEGPDAVEPHYNEVASATKMPSLYSIFIVSMYADIGNKNAVRSMLKNASGVPMTVQLTSVL